MLRHRQQEVLGVSRMVVRLVKVYRQAENMPEAEAWYGNAYQVARTLAAGTQYTTRQCAAVIAVLSPRVSWANNVIAARSVVEAHAAGVNVESVTCAAFGRNVREAYRILDGQQFVGGPKTGQFYRAIMGDAQAVTLDIWAWRGATGQDMPASVTVAARAAVDTAYRQAARRLNVSPRDMQSIVWCAVRGTHA